MSDFGGCVIVFEARAVQDRRGGGSAAVLVYIRAHLWRAPAGYRLGPGQLEGRRGIHAARQ